MATSNFFKTFMAEYKLSSVWVRNYEKDRRFPEEDLKNVLEATVVQGDFGLSVKVKAVDPETGDHYAYYQVLSKKSRMILGDKVDLSKCMIICLEKGDEEVFRIEEI